MSTKILSQLSPAQAVALTKTSALNINTDALRHTNTGEQVQHSGSVAVVIDYSFQVSADEEYTPTISMPYKAVLGLLASQSPEMAQMVTEAMNSALTAQALKASGDEDAIETLNNAVKAVPEATAQVDDMLKALPKSTRKGKINQVKIEAQAFEVLSLIHI